MYVVEFSGDVVWFGGCGMYGVGGEVGGGFG